MQTPQILTPASVNPASSPAARQADAGAPDKPFKDVLSREMNGRGADTAKPSESASGPAPAQAASAPAAKDKPPAGEAASQSDGLPAEEQDLALAASAEVLALVASITQAGAGTAGPAQTADATDDAAVSATEQSVALAPKITPTVAGITDSVEMATVTQAASTGQTSAPTAKDTAARTDNTSSFSAAMEKHGTAKAQADTTEAKVGDAPPKQGAPEFAAPAKVQDNLRAAHGLNNTQAPASEPTPASAPQAMQSVQHAGLNPVQAAAPHAQEKLSPRVGTPAWDQALGQKVVWMVAGEQQSASLTLNPPDLGPLQVVLNVSNSQANATFISAQPEVRQALEAALPKLRDMLGDAGIQLGQASVNSGTPGQQHAQGERHANGSNRAESPDHHADAPLRTSRVPIPAAGRGLVDTFA